jgi:endo-1,4-beta-xylanase
MNSMSPGNNMKPQYTVDVAASAAAYNAAGTQAARDSINTHPIVRFNGDLIAQLNWAKRQGFTFRGHVLVWHSQTPAEFFRSGYSNSQARLTKEQMLARLDNYIREMIRLLHEGWPGLLSAMDVVNEAIDDGPGFVRRTGNEWFTTVGDSTYIMKAFEFARNHTALYGETQMKLYYNDYNTHSPAKADGIARLVQPIFQAGFLDGIGMQDHDANDSPTAAQWIASYDKFNPVCTEMAVTELDVTAGSANPPPAVLQTQANQYGQLFKCFVERSYLSGRGKIINVSKDGLNDQYTFKVNQASSLWDALNKCKPAFYDVVEVGESYNDLDSLLAYADSLEENEYTADSWAPLAAARASAEGTMARNYSSTLSAADSLTHARDAMESALQNLVEVSVGVVAASGRPRAFSLSQNYPNPFNPSTRIRYSIGGRTHVSLKVYNLLGAEVATLVDEPQNEGEYEVAFDASRLSSGVYLYRLTAGEFQSAKRLAIVR